MLFDNKLFFYCPQNPPQPHRWVAASTHEVYGLGPSTFQRMHRNSLPVHTRHDDCLSTLVARLNPSLERPARTAHSQVCIHVSPIRINENKQIHPGWKYHSIDDRPVMRYNIAKTADAGLQHAPWHVGKRKSADYPHWLNKSRPIAVLTRRKYQQTRLIQFGAGWISRQLSVIAGLNARQEEGLQLCRIKQFWELMRWPACLGTIPPETVSVFSYANWM